eukprot:15439242-Alexandrium_andersonii.AAC.1
MCIRPSLSGLARVCKCWRAHSERSPFGSAAVQECQGQTGAYAAHSPGGGGHAAGNHTLQQLL